MAVLPGLLREGESGSLQLSLTPLPAAPVTFSLQASIPGLLTLPEAITVPVTGSVSIPVSVARDGSARGFQETAILAWPPDSAWPPAAAALQIIDSDRPVIPPEGVLRVMSFNVKLGTGMPGSAEFNALREIVERISPDVLLLQEVAGANDFADFRSLAQQAGFPADPAHVAIFGDAFAGQAYVRRYQRRVRSEHRRRQPVVVPRQRVQCGRGLAGRVEITRYPMLFTVDVPWLPDEADPAIVNVHLKADEGDSNNFRRALEAYRLREAIAAAGLNPASANVIIAGDFNATDWQPQPVSYQTNVPAVLSPGTGQFADGTSLPGSFAGAADLTSPGFTLPYKSFPHSGFNPAGLTALPLRQADGASDLTFAFASYKLDYFFVSPGISARERCPRKSTTAGWKPSAMGCPNALPCRLLPSAPPPRTTSPSLPTFHSSRSRHSACRSPETGSPKAIPPSPLPSPSCRRRPFLSG